MHFHPTKPIILSCDASPYGTEAVLSHKMKDESERPVAYFSRTYKAMKETMTILNVSHFDQYIFSNHFDLITDRNRFLD